MTAPLRHRAWMMCFSAMLTLCLASVTARAESPPETEELSAQGSAEQQRHKSARRVLATQQSYTLAIDERGTLWEWGIERGHGFALAPLGETVSPTPARVSGMPKTVSVSMATFIDKFHSLALQEDGRVQAWGDNGHGQLGDGTTAPRLTRVTVPGLTDMVAIAAGGIHSLAVRADGTVWAWGNNQAGQLGDGTLADSRSLPVQVLGLTGVVAVAAGFGHSLALREDGTVWGWGSDLYGQLGTGTGSYHLVPVQIMDLTDVVAIDARDDSSYAIRADGTVWGWGLNESGQLGLPPENPVQPVPAQVPGVTRVVSLAAGGFHALAVRRDGSVWSWGGNGSGQRGHGPRGDIRTPAPVPGLHGVVAVAGCGPHSLALQRNGSLWAWGYNGAGSMGTGTDRRILPSPVRLSHVRSVAGHIHHSLAVREDGTVWWWGYPHFVSMGLAPQATPARLEGLEGAVDVAEGGSFSLVRKQDGTVWAWGYNSQGQLGDGTLVSRETPAPVSGLMGVVAVSAGSSHSLALKQDGTAWAWGSNSFGQLGDLTLTHRSIPVQVQGLDGVVAVVAQGSLSVALRSDGTVWHWGSTSALWNQGDKQPRPPAQVAGLTGVVALAVRNGELSAVRSDGTVWQWQLRLPSQVSPPQQVAGFTDAVGVARSINTLQVLRADGTVWNSGVNRYGERGFPSIEATPPGPTEVPDLRQVTALSSRDYHIHALRADGTLVEWGTGIFGDGVSPLHLEPTRVELPRR